MPKEAPWTALCLLCKSQSGTEITTFHTLSVLFSFQDTFMHGFHSSSQQAWDRSRAMIIIDGEN